MAISSPLDLPDDAVNVVIKPEFELGVCAVATTAIIGFGGLLDEAAYWLHATILVDDVIGQAQVEQRQ
jgi:hypothetical protein